MGTSFGRGGATTFQQDLANADVITVMGSNMAEQHPVGFQWVVEAQRRGAKVFHVDPRFTRTSAIADVHMPLRSGSDIAYLGGIINHILSNGREFRDYVVNYTNAATIISDDYVDAEDADGIFSGYDPESGTYSPDSWQYAGMEVAPASGQREMDVAAGEAHGSGGAALEHGDDGVVAYEVGTGRFVT
ncbi:MAG: molybdopterin-dependent oxidoreductase, partial [Actinobacteria bacterium]|nr:molybdopterin-dependent oxidoreductase [Actinomycetota bacterium]